MKTNKKLILSTLGASLIFGTAAYAAQGDYIVVLKEAPVISLMDEDNGVVKYVDNVYVVDSLMSAYALAPSDNIEMIVPDEVAYLFDNTSDETATLTAAEFPEGTNDTYYDSQWYLPYIKVNAAWRNGFDGSGVRVGIIDSGMETTHPDLPTPVKVYNVLDQADSSNVSDGLGHGTSVTGVIAAKTNNGRFVSGIAYNSEIVSIKVASESSLATSDLILGFKKAIEYGCDVINMSLGFTKEDSPGAYNSMKPIIKSAIDDGVIIVASAGNGGADSVKGAYYEYPASYDNVVSVGSLGRAGKDTEEDIKVPSPTNSNAYYPVYADVPSTFTQFNDGLTCAAPGYLIVTTSINSTVDLKAGTSFASPVVAAAAAIAKQINPDITAPEFIEALKETCTDVHTEGYDIYTGYGAINIEALVNYLSDEPSPSPEVTDEPTSTPEVTDEPSPSPEVTDEPTSTPEATDEPSPSPEVTEEPSPASAVKITATYDENGRLINVALENIEIYGDEVFESTETVKVFVWNSFDEMRALL